MNDIVNEFTKPMPTTPVDTSTASSTQNLAGYLFAAASAPVALEVLMHAPFIL
jgi:hypothetical protein